MSRSPSVRVVRTPLACSRCGHSELITSLHPFGTDRLWYTYCPVCGDLRERAAIPEWFVEGLPLPPRRRRFH